MKQATFKTRVTVAATALLASAAMFAAPAAQAAWEPTKPVEFVVPAGTGGGADQMARLIQGIVVKHNLMKEPLVVVNRSGGAGAEGFLDVKNSKGDPHKLVITLSNLFTTPLATGVPFNWRDMTPVSMMALDNFVLWVNAEKPYKSAKEYFDAVKAAGPSKMKMGGTGSKQEDQILTVGVEKATGTKFIYVPFKGGGEAIAAIIGGHVTAGVSGLGEFAEQIKGKRMRALAVSSPEPIDGIPTMKEQGVDVVLGNWRGCFGGPSLSTEQRDTLVAAVRKATETKSWKDTLEKFGWTPWFMGGDEYKKFLDEDIKRVGGILRNLGLVKT